MQHMRREEEAVAICPCASVRGFRHRRGGHAARARGARRVEEAAARRQQLGGWRACSYYCGNVRGSIFVVWHPAVRSSSVYVGPGV